eukprot:scaffold13738_cov90-Skeletonema_marinoi.AAC.1
METCPLPQRTHSQDHNEKDHENVLRSYKFDQIVPPTQGYLFDKIGAQYNNEGAPPFYAESTNMGRRRGLFASRDMRKGE